MTHQQKMVILTAVLLAMFLGALDQTIVSAAAPSIVADLQGMERFTWLSTSYLMASTALVPIYGKLADLYSRKSVVIGALSIFLLGSCLCGLAGQFKLILFFCDGMNQLIIARAIQGLGGAGLFTMAFVIIADLFTPAQRGRYQGYTGAVFAVASILGPTLGGFLTDYGSYLIPAAGWRLVFFINLPIGLIALYIVIEQMPALIPEKQHKNLDWLSAFLLICGISTLVLAIQSCKNGADMRFIISLFLAAISAMFLFVFRSLHISNPILNFGLFKNLVFRQASLTIFLLGGVFLGIIIFEPLFMVKVLHKSATASGMGLIPLSLGIVCTSMLSGRMVSKYGHYKYWMLGGLTLLAVALLLITTTEYISFERLICYLAMCGLGLGPTMPLYTLAVQNAVERHQIGQATSACQFSRQMGGVIISAILGMIMALYLSNNLMKSATACYSTAISHIHEAILLVVVVAFVVTLSVPELQLKDK